MTTIATGAANPPHANNLDAIAAQVNKVFAGFVARGDETKAANDMAKAARETAATHRIGAVTAVAKLADDNNWSALEVEAGVSRALDSRNDKSTTLAVFASEIKRACNPHVRKSVPALFQLAQNCFDAEKEASNKPCRRAFSRAYFMAMRLMGEVLKGRTFADIDAGVAYANENDPTLDAIKIAKRIASIKTLLGEMHDDFPHEGLQACMDYLGTLTADELTRARANATQDDEDASPENVSEPETTSEEPAPARDPLDEALDGLVAAPNLRRLSRRRVSSSPTERVRHATLTPGA